MENRFETFTVLINRISRNIRKIKNQEMAEYGLRSAHISCLYYLYTGKGLTATDLCECCEDDKATISQALEFLEDEGYLFCESKTAKRCKSPLVLTEKGEQIAGLIAAADFENIYVVDSASAAIGAAVLTELALRYLDEGLEAKEIAERLEEEKKRILIVALLDTLEYLKRGGRISKTVAFAGAVLNIKPVIAVSGREIMVLGKARGSKMGNNLLEQEIEKAGGVDFSAPVLLGYTGLSDLVLRKYIEDSRRLWEEGLDEVRFTNIGSVIGAHAGPGAIAVAFFKK